MREGRAKVQQQTATYQDNQEDLTVRVIAIQDTTHALAELTTIQHTGSPHHRESVRAPVKRVCPNTIAPVVQPTIKDITLPPRESTRMNHRRGVRFSSYCFRISRGSACTQNVIMHCQRSSTSYMSHTYKL